MKPSPSRRLLRRLGVILAVVVGFVIYSYGWSVTQINLDRPQEPLRQQNAGNALRELLSPNVFEQNYDIQNTTATILMDCPADGSAPAQEASTPPDASTPYIVVSPRCASSGDLVTVQGYNFFPDSLARINWIPTDGERRIRQVVGTTEDNFITNDNGSFNVEIEVPRIRGSSGQTHSIEAQGSFPAGPPHLSATTGLVVQKMIETIFLALIATSLAILPAAGLSFFAAHNLMRPVRTTLGGLMISVALLPVGWVVGQAVFGLIGTFGLKLGSGAYLGSSALGVAPIFLMGAVTSSKLHSTQTDLGGARWRSILNLVLGAAIFVFVLSLVGGVGLLLGTLAGEGIIGYVANFIRTVGELIQLLMPLIVGVTGIFVISSLGGTLTRDALKQIDSSLGHILGAGLGAICGAILLGIVAGVAMQAAWLGLLVPLSASTMAAPILPMLYDRLMPGPKGAARTSIKRLLSWGTIALVFVLVFLEINLRRTLVEGILPGQSIVLSVAGISLSVYSTQIMIIGAVLGGISGALAGMKATFPAGTILYSGTRTILNALRSIEPLIMGLVFVIWVGIGPFAGVLALTLHSIASLGKLYSEQIENIDDGPIEALESTGANRLQTIIYAVVPQIVPPYIAFTMYRWDINVRMSTIIGFVGGGGIGFLLQQQINLLRYRDAGVAVLAIAVVVSVLDYASASIRERII